MMIEEDNSNFKETSMLKSVFFLKTLDIGVTGGRDIISTNNDLFAAGISPKFKSLNLNKLEGSKEAISVKAFSLKLDASPAQILGAFNGNLLGMCFTQNQIVEFCRLHKDCLSLNNHNNLFFIAQNTHYYVVGVRIQIDDSLLVDVDSLNSVFSFLGNCNSRVFVPELCELRVK